MLSLSADDWTKEGVPLDSLDRETLVVKQFSSIPKIYLHAQ